MTLEAAANAGVVSFTDTRARIDDDIDIRQLMLMLAEGFSDQSLDSIALDCTANDAGGGGQSEARRIVAGVADEHGEHCIAESLRLPIDAVELRFVVKPLRRGEGAS